MTFRELTVKEFFANPDFKRIMEENAPVLAKNPAIKLVGKKSCGEIFDLVVSKKLIPEATARKIESEVNALLSK